MNARSPRPTGRPSELKRRPATAPAVARFDRERRQDERPDAFRYSRSERFFVGPITQVGVWAPFTQARRDETVCAVRVYLGQAETRPVAGVNAVPQDRTGRIPTDTGGEAEAFVLRLVDAEGVPYVDRLPIRRCSTLNWQNPSTGRRVGYPVAYEVQPMRTMLDGGGVRLEDPNFVIGVNWYVLVELFYK